MATKRMSVDDVLRAHSDMHRGIKQLLSDMMGTDEVVYNEAVAALKKMSDVAVPALVEVACSSRTSSAVTRMVCVLVEIGQSAVLPLAAEIQRRKLRGDDLTLVAKTLSFRLHFRDLFSDDTPDAVDHRSPDAVPAITVCTQDQQPK